MHRPYVNHQAWVRLIDREAEFRASRGAPLNAHEFQSCRTTSSPGNFLPFRGVKLESESFGRRRGASAATSPPTTSPWFPNWRTRYGCRRSLIRRGCVEMGVAGSQAPGFRSVALWVQVPPPPAQFSGTEPNWYNQYLRRRFPSTPNLLFWKPLLPQGTICTLSKPRFR